jgi:hypothetical protein
MNITRPPAGTVTADHWSCDCEPLGAVALLSATGGLVPWKTCATVGIVLENWLFVSCH